MDTEDVAKAVEERRVWLLSQIEAAAPRFGVELVGEVMNTFDMRSAGALARRGDRDVWLRVVVEDRDYEPACRWNGNVEANAIRGVPKPRVLRWSDWTNTDGYLHGRRLRGEVMTLAPGSTVRASQRTGLEPEGGMTTVATMPLWSRSGVPPGREPYIVT